MAKINQEEKWKNNYQQFTRITIKKMFLKHKKIKPKINCRETPLMTEIKEDNNYKARTKSKTKNKQRSKNVRKSKENWRIKKNKKSKSVRMIKR